MKFRSKTGKVFNNIYDAYCAYTCTNTCYECPLAKERGAMGCSDWAIKNPVKAARLMGYEVIEDEKEDTMDKPLNL